MENIWPKEISGAWAGQKSGERERSGEWRLQKTMEHERNAEWGGCGAGMESAVLEMPWASSAFLAPRAPLTCSALVYRCLHDLAPPYLSSTLHRVSDVDSRRRLRSSADTDIFLVLRSRLVTVSDRSFPVARPRKWNNLLETVRSASSLQSFKRQLKTVLFSRRYTEHWHSYPNIVDLAVFFNLGHFKKSFHITVHYIYNWFWV